MLHVRNSPLFLLKYLIGSVCVVGRLPQTHVRVYHLLKQMLVKKLITGCKWISCIDVHPTGTPIWPWCIVRDAPFEV